MSFHSTGRTPAMRALIHLQQIGGAGLLALSAFFAMIGLAGAADPADEAGWWALFLVGGLIGVAYSAVYIGLQSASLRAVRTGRRATLLSCQAAAAGQAAFAAVPMRPALVLVVASAAIAALATWPQASAMRPSSAGLASRSDFGRTRTV